jgi:hypothetical protein
MAKLVLELTCICGTGGGGGDKGPGLEGLELRRESVFILLPSSLTAVGGAKGF